MIAFNKTFSMKVSRLVEHTLHVTVTVFPVQQHPFVLCYSCIKIFSTPNVEVRIR